MKFLHSYEIDTKLEKIRNEEDILLHDIKEDYRKIKKHHKEEQERYDKLMNKIMVFKYIRDIFNEDNMNFAYKL